MIRSNTCRHEACLASSRSAPSLSSIILTTTFCPSLLSRPPFAHKNPGIKKNTHVAQSLAASMARLAGTHSEYPLELDID
jgi:hypothetical protein